MADLTRGARWIRPAAPAALLVVLGALLFQSAGHDDTHLTCWPAYTLSHFGQILNYNGERVEQSSSLLEVLLLAGAEKVTAANFVTLAKLVSIAFGAATVWALFVLVSRIANPAVAWCAALVAATSTPIVYWSFSGMETPVVSFTGVVLVLAVSDFVTAHPSGSLWTAGLALAAFAMVRPETPILIVCLLTATLAILAAARPGDGAAIDARNATPRRAATLLLVAVFICVALVLFRLEYFGALFPQPVTAKFSGVSASVVLNGLHYLKWHAWNPGPATAAVSIVTGLSAVLVAVGQLRTRVLNLHVVVSLLFAGGYLAAVILAGGDWMEGGRFLAHFLPLALACVPLALDQMPWRGALPLVTAVVVGLQLTAAVTFARTSSTGAPLWAAVGGAPGLAPAGGEYSWFERRNRINIRDIALIDRLDRLVRAISERKTAPVVILSGQMGMVPYHLALRHFGRVRFVDRHGLADRILTGCAIAQDLRRDTGGLIASFAWLSDHRATLERRCHVASPDIVFDLGTSDVERYGYPVAYSQSGDVTMTGTGLAGLRVKADALVAVEPHLLDQLRTVPAEGVEQGLE